MSIHCKLNKYSANGIWLAAPDKKKAPSGGRLPTGAGSTSARDARRRDFDERTRRIERQAPLHMTTDDDDRNQHHGGGDATEHKPNHPQPDAIGHGPFPFLKSLKDLTKCREENAGGKAGFRIFPDSTRRDVSLVPRHLFHSQVGEKLMRSACLTESRQHWLTQAAPQQNGPRRGHSTRGQMASAERG